MGTPLLRWTTQGYSVKERLDLDMEKAHSGDGETETMKRVVGRGGDP